MAISPDDEVRAAAIAQERSCYREQCCICRLRHLELLDAAHILPDRHPAGDPVVTNGLGLCKIHHSAYDANIIGVDPATRVHVREDILREKDGPMLRHGLQEVDGARLILPRDGELRPNPEFLAERFERFWRRDRCSQGHALLSPYGNCVPPAAGYSWPVADRHSSP
jgi:predicted restriction endonuclease